MMRNTSTHSVPLAKTTGQRYAEPFGVARFLYYSALFAMSATAFRPLGGFTLSDLVFLASLIAVVIELGSSGRGNFRGLPRLLVYGVGFFLLGGLASSTNTLYVGESLGVLMRFIYLTLVWFWLGAMVLRNGSNVVRAVTIWVLSAAIAGSAAVIQAVWGYDVVPSALAGPIFFGRVAGVTLHPNDLGAITSFAIVPCLALLTLGGQTVRARAGFLAAAAAIAAGLIVSGSVGGLGSALLAVCGWLLLSGSKRPQIALVLLLVGLGAWFTFGVLRELPIASPLERIQQVTADNPTASLQSRLQLDAATFDVMLGHPFIGVGLDLASQRQTLYSPPEDMFLLAWLGGGLFALVGLLLVVIACLREGWRAIHDPHSGVPRSVGTGLLISFGSTLVFTLASPILQQRYAWVGAGILLAMRAQLVGADRFVFQFGHAGSRIPNEMRQ